MRPLLPWIAAILLSGFLAACGPSSEFPERASAPAVVKAPIAAVEQRMVQSPYEAVGTVRAKVTSTIQSKIMGHVLAVHVHEGSPVEAGQVLVEIDAREAESQVKRAESGLREAQEMRQETDKMAQAALHAKTAAEAGKELAKATFERHERLLASKAVSRQAFDEAETKLKEAVAEAAGANETMLSLQAKRGEAEARIEQANAELTNAKTLLSFSVLTAPFAGVVTSKTVEVGDLAAPGSPLLVVEDPKQYRLEAQVDEEHVHTIEPGLKTPVVLDSLDGKELPGVVSEVVPAADPSSRTFVVKIDLPQEPSLRSGMFGRARFDSGGKQKIIVPQTAVFQRGQLTGVYVAGEGGVAQLRLITMGKAYGAEVEVLSGLEPGETIVVDKIGQITEGAVVRPE